MEFEAENGNYVLLLKSRKADDEYESQIAKVCNLEVVSIPVLDFTYKNIDQLSASLVDIDNFGGLVFTSPRAVEALSKALNSCSLHENKELLSSVEKTKVFVVGKATERALNKVQSELGIDLQCDGSNEGSAENLANYMKDLKDVCDETRPFLFACGNIARETLPKILATHNIHVKSTCVYETVPDSNFKENLATLVSKRGCPAVIVFFSPSGVDFSLKIIQNFISAFDSVKTIAIGHTTARAFHDKGYKVHGISEKPTAAHLSLCIKNVLAGTS